ncbi:MAG: LEA type 2 family protein [Methanoregulaceae archaeon]
MIDEVDVRGISLSRLDLEVRLHVTNPNFFGVIVRDVPFRLELLRESGEVLEIARGNAGRMKIPRNGSTRVTVPVSTDNSGLLFVLTDLLARNGASVSITGVVTVDCWITGWSFPFTRTMTVTPAMIAGLGQRR